MTPHTYSNHANPPRKYMANLRHWVQLIREIEVLADILNAKEKEIKEVKEEVVTEMTALSIQDFWYKLIREREVLTKLLNAKEKEVKEMKDSLKQDFEELYPDPPKSEVFSVEHLEAMRRRTIIQ